MPAEAKGIVRWVAIGSLTLGLVGGLVQGLILAYWSGAKIERKADIDNVPNLPDFLNLRDDFYSHCIGQAEVTGQVTQQLQAQTDQLDRIERRIVRLHENGGIGP